MSHHTCSIYTRVPCKLDGLQVFGWILEHMVYDAKQVQKLSARYTFNALIRIYCSSKSWLQMCWEFFNVFNSHFEWVPSPKNCYSCNIPLWRRLLLVVCKKNYDVIKTKNNSARIWWCIIIIGGATFFFPPIIGRCMTLRTFATITKVALASSLLIITDKWLEIWAQSKDDLSCEDHVHTIPYGCWHFSLFSIYDSVSWRWIVS